MIRNYKKIACLTMTNFQFWGWKCLTLKGLYLKKCIAKNHTTLIFKIKTTHWLTWSIFRHQSIWLSKKYINLKIYQRIVLSLKSTISLEWKAMIISSKLSKYLKIMITFICSCRKINQVYSKYLGWGEFFFKDKCNTFSAS